MGAAALAHSVESTLAATMQAKNAVAPKTAEVLRLKPLIKMKKIADEAVDVAARWRGELIESADHIFGCTREIQGDKELWVRSKTERLIATIAAASEQIADNVGFGLADSMDEWAAAASARSADEGRYGKRAAKRVRDAFEACEAPRRAVLGALAEAADQVAVKLRTAVDDRHRHDDMFKKTLAKYPVITEYLAR